MKFLSLTLAAVLALGVAPSFAADPHAGHKADAMTKAAAADAMSEGTVKKVDKAAGKVTINHGPLARLQMPPMTMAFKVKDPGWLEEMKPGDKIHFVADKVDGALTVIEYQAAH